MKSECSNLNFSNFEHLISMLFLIAVESTSSFDSIFCLSVIKFCSFFHRWSFRCTLRYWIISFFSYRALCFRYADFELFAYFAHNLHFVSPDLHFRFCLISNSSSWNFCNDLDITKKLESMLFHSILLNLVHNSSILGCFSMHLSNW